jgi:hypothetical protein
MNHRRMERAPSQPKSDESDVDHSERAAFTVRRRAYTNFPARRRCLNFNGKLPLAACSFRMFCTHVDDHHGGNTRAHQR